MNPKISVYVFFSEKYRVEILWGAEPLRTITGHRLPLADEFEILDIFSDQKSP
mgnify:CR=1 FL=1